MADQLQVEVVWATKDAQEIVELLVADGQTVEGAIRESGIYDKYPRNSLEDADVGIWGRVVSRDTRVRDGDRVEIYRPLEMDPREARRLRS